MRLAMSLGWLALLPALAIGCAATPPREPTPNIGATVEAAVRTALPRPTPTPDIQATVEASVRATVEALPPPTPSPTPTPLPPTPSPIPTRLPPTPSPQPTSVVTLPTPAATATPPPFPTERLGIGVMTIRTGFGTTWGRSLRHERVDCRGRVSTPRAASGSGIRGT